MLVLVTSCGGSALEGVVCPTNFILVPRNAAYVEEAFCVSRVEARNSGTGIADFDLTKTPWVNITRDSAISRCQSLGSGYDLINNNQWQTIARNIELQQENWSSNEVGTGFINEGHGDGTPSAPIAITDESDVFNGTGQTSGDQKRTHVLSNGEIIWDFSGNVWEWVKDTNSTDYGTDGFMSLISDSTNPNSGALSDGISRTLKNQFGPVGSYSLAAPPYGNLGHAFVNTGIAGGIYRGGSYQQATTAVEGGIFSVKTTFGANVTSGNVGFRCVYTNTP